MAKIKTCPHCGADAELKISYSMKTRTNFIFVRCNLCNAQGRTYRVDIDDEEQEEKATADAIGAWNLRVSDRRKKAKEEPETDETEETETAAEA